MSIRMLPDPTKADDGGSAPSWMLLGAEPLRAMVEYLASQFASRAELPRGDGHPVVLFPGLAADARSLAPLRQLCVGLGYAAYDWGRGFNTGPHGEIGGWLDALASDVQALVASHRGRVSLIGWSLGGIYAREVARRLPRRTRQVISIGSPFAGTAAQTRAGLAYRALNGRYPVLEPELQQCIAQAPRVPTTSIYSRSDGVVAWQACIQAGGHERTENIEVSGSHCGLGWNPQVLQIVADRLAQPEGAWRAYVAATPSASSAAPIDCRARA